MNFWLKGKTYLLGITYKLIWSTLYAAMIFPVHQLRDTLCVTSNCISKFIYQTKK